MVKLPPKRDVMLALLESSSVYIHLDPRKEDVQVPSGFTRQPQLVLQVGLNMAVPIVDLDVGETGVSATLSFNRRPHFCFFPWASVFALVSEDGRSMVWPQDIPPEVLATSAPRAVKDEDAAAKKSSARSGRSAAKAARAKLRAVPGGRDEHGSSELAIEPGTLEPAQAVEPPAERADKSLEPAAEPSRKLPSRGHLRRVK
jgi:stringent starvation protein B